MKAIISKKTIETQSYKTGAPVRAKAKWLVMDALTGRLIDTAKTQAQAQERARFAGYTI